MSRSSSIRAVLLDIDGTLIDSNDAHARAWVDALAAHGHQVPFERVRPLIGSGGDKVLPQLTGIEEDSEAGQRIASERSRIFKEKYLPTLRAFDGAADLLREMKSRGLQLVVATSAKEEELDGLLAVIGAPDVFDARTSSDDAERSKPDPDIVQAALGQVDAPREAVLMIGDTPYDLEAAGRAGVGLIGVRCGGWDDEALRGAVAIYDGPADLLARLDESPIGSTEDE
jgi:HAD superfamily hydrolase (TIGR01509 family)